MSLIVVPDLSALASEAARIIVETGQEAVRHRGRYMLAISGGATPPHIFRELTSNRFREELEWSMTHVFWTDERCVPPTDPESNYGMARDNLLNHIPVMRTSRLRGELEDNRQAAREYERQLRSAFGLQGADLPSFDLVLLGIGSDGHVASLFPGSPSLSVTDRLAIESHSSDLITDRISLTLPVLNNARRCLFVVSGDRKRAILRRILHAQGPDATVPATLIRPRQGELIWVIDEAASGGRELWNQPTSLGAGEWRQRHG